MEGKSPLTRLVVVVSAGIAAAGLLYSFDPAHNSFYPGCAFYLLTGWYCPGCGATRALHQLLHANIADAFRLNPLLLLFYLPFLAIVMAKNLPRYVRREVLQDLSISQRSGWAVVGLIVGFWLLRNTPHYPYQ